MTNTYPSVYGLREFLRSSGIAVPTPLPCQFDPPPVAPAHLAP